MAHLSGAELHEYVRQSETCQFYKDKTLLVTGVTGFCGKVFFEKIARVLFPVKRVYVLIRSKKGQTAKERLDALLRSQAFSFHEYSADQLNKLIAINGDCSEIDMGLSDQDKHTLINEVDIVFHSAASVRFDASIPYNFKQNTLGTKYMVDLIKKFKKIDHFVYVSTASVNCQFLKLEDKIADFKDDIDSIIDKLHNAKSDEEMEKLAEPYVEGRPNSYVLTKAFCEAYVKKHCQMFDDEYNNNLKNNSRSTINSELSGKNFKTYVVRPAVVYNSKAEPTFGWIDSFNGPSAFSTFLLLGLVCYPEMNFDQVFQIIPVDYLANALISVPYLYSIDQTNEDSKDEIKVVTLTYDQVIGYTVMQQGEKYFEATPSLYLLRLPDMPPIRKPENTLLRRFKIFVFEYLWVHAMDFLLWIFGLKKKVSLVRLYNKYHHALQLMDYFLNNYFELPTENYKRLVKLQSVTDSVLFDFDVANYDADQIASSYVTGTRRYLLKEPDSTIDIAKKKVQSSKILLHPLHSNLFYHAILCIQSNL